MITTPSAEDDAELVRQLHAQGSVAVSVVQSTNSGIGGVFMRRRAQDGECGFQDWLAMLGLPLTPGDVSLFLQWGANSTDEMMARIDTERQRVIEAGSWILPGTPGSMEDAANQINSLLATSLRSHLDTKKAAIAAGRILLEQKRQMGDDARFNAWVREFVTDTPERAEAAMTFALYDVPEGQAEIAAAMLDNRVESAARGSAPEQAMQGELSPMVLRRFADLFDRHCTSSREALQASHGNVKAAAEIVRFVRQSLAPDAFETWAASLKIPRAEVDSMIGFADSSLADILKGPATT